MLSAEASCSGFEPQTYLRERCKKCFRLRSKHNVGENNAERTSTIIINKNNNDSGDSGNSCCNNINNSSDNISTNDGQPEQQQTSVTSKSTRERTREKRRSWREKMSTGTQDNGAPEHVSEVNEEDTTSCTSYKSASSKGLSSAKSIESISSNQDTKSMITAISESIQDDDRAATPMEGGDGDLQNFDATMMKTEIARLMEEITKLKEERQKWTLRREKREHNGADESLIDMLEERLAEAENCIQDYRDENTVLKCELRELQECDDREGNNTHDDDNDKLMEKLKASESLCEELMDENETLKADVKDLQQEIEEMQDQYREEEIEEFRELQRELEQNAKNCRILQFKLRKSERSREQLDAEKQHLEAKVKDLLEASSAASGRPPSEKPLDAMRIRELESELRIAKEVSVRLHNELENTEEKRYKLEDEVFYLKDKVRELQTQNKWREARNRAEVQAKRASADLSISSTDSDTSKEMRDVLEREADLRDQLKFAEEDLRRTQLRLQDVENENEELLRKLTRLKTVKKPPMTRSFSEGHAQIQLELAEHEMEHLSTKVERLEKKNIHLSKKIMELELDSKKTIENGEMTNGRVPQFDVSPEMQRDMSKLMTTISELERKNLELSMQLKKHNELNLPTESKKSDAELRIEKEHKKIIENELMELKRMMLQSDNQKLISMATKVELLNNQLLLVNDRCGNLHRKIVREGSGEAAYMDALKSKCEDLERQLSEEKAKSAVTGLQIDSATTDEIEQCCEVLASVETQTNRICKQIEKIDNAQKDERRRSLSKDNSATIIAELAGVMSELNNVHQLLEAHKVNIASVARRSPVKNVSNSDLEPKPCNKCKENEALIESQKDEIVFYKKKNKELTNQVLQTEDRWTVEIEKQRQSYENEIHTLQTKLNDTQRNVTEQEHLLESRAVALDEKVRMIQERDEKCEKLKNELLDLKKEIQEIEADRKSSKEFEIKYKKLESMFDLEKEKLAQERAKSKSEVALLKKKSEETLVDLEKLRNTYAKKEKTWQEERDKLEDEITNLRKQLKKDITDNAAEEFDYISIPVVHQSVKNEVVLENDNVADLKDKLANLQKKNEYLTEQISKLKNENEELRSELSSSQQKWTKDKDNLLHKARQAEKIQNVELDALQQKFSSRMRIMEDTNKSLHSQLVQARRERDYHREALYTYERKVSEEQQRNENDVKRQKELVQKCADMEKKIRNLTEEITKLNSDLKLEKDAHEADRNLWKVERSHFKPRKITSSTGGGSGTDKGGDDTQNVKITESALKAAETVQKKYAEYQKFYAKEVERLNAKIKELVNEDIVKQRDSDRTIKDLREQIKVLEISQRNLMEARDMQLGAKELLETELEKLQETLNLNEVQRLTRKYKISSIIEQLQLLTESLRKMSRHENDSMDLLKATVSQLKQVKEEDCQPLVISDGGEKQTNAGERLGPVGSESDAASQTLSDATSQTSISTRFYPYSTLPTSSYKVSASVSQGVTESSSAVDIRQLEAIAARAQSPIKKISGFPDPPPNFILNKEKAVEYDKDGRLHYIPKSISRSGSRDRQDDDGDLTTEKPSRATIDDDDSSLEQLHSRTNSTGTNFLYRVRRVELARGTQPSVRLIAKAFETMEANGPKSIGQHNSKRSLFGIRKSRSVETTETGKGVGSAAKSVLMPGAPSPVAVTVLGRNTSLSHIEELMGSQSPFGNITRGGRNPFKNMGTKLVERVRRSLSRSNSKRSRDRSAESGCGSLKQDSESITITEKKFETPSTAETSSSEKIQNTKVTTITVSKNTTTTTTTKPRIKKKAKKSATTNLAGIKLKLSSPSSSSSPTTTGKPKT